jgi:hypothetical protein
VRLEDWNGFHRGINGIRIAGSLRLDYIGTISGYRINEGTKLSRCKLVNNPILFQHSRSLINVWSIVWREMVFY